MTDSLLVLFDACWRRIDRASTHRAAAAAVWNKFLEQHPYEFTVVHEGGGSFVMRVHQEIPTPPEMAVLIGEWLYNLRCALDYSVYAAAVCVSGQDPPPGAGQLQFPIYESEAAFRENLYRVKPLAAHHRTILETMQPYRHEDPDTSALGWLNRLARIDRHRRLTITTAYVAELRPVIGVPVGCTVELEWGERVMVDHVAEIARFNVTPWEEEWKVETNPQAGIDPEIAEWGQITFLASDRLQHASSNAGCCRGVHGGDARVRLPGF